MRLIYLPLLLFILFGCRSEQNINENKKLYLIEESKLSVPEPSGLAYTFNKDGFWTVSDENSSVYLLNLEGKVIEKFKVDGKDLEGITVIDEKTIAVISERTGEILILDTNGNEMSRMNLEIKYEENLGLEGITFNRSNKLFYLVTERKPGLLIKTDEKLNIISADTLKFAKDYSGIFFDEKENSLWILSDESQLVAKTDLNGNVIEKFETKIDQAEGICIDDAREKIFFVSDRKEKFYVYSLNSP
jgi:uncharacterized protein YjiK